MEQTTNDEKPDGAASGLTDVLEDKRLRYCSFCGGGEHEREYLIAAAGPVYICEQCVDVCRDVIGAARESKRTAAERKDVSANVDVTGAGKRRDSDA